jgi:hypothetical protein
LFGVPPKEDAFLPARGDTIVKVQKAMKALKALKALKVMKKVVAPAAATVGLTAQQFLQWKYGVPGLVALALLCIGLKARNQTCSAIGAVALALMVSRPAL